MAEDWATDVKKYVPDADDAVIAGIVRYCGIALRNRDSSLVSFTDPEETGRVRDGYCRKKLGLTDPDPVVDATIARVGERMAGDATKNRVTVYYLLAEAFGKLGLFANGAAPTAGGVSPDAPERPIVPAAPAVAATVAAATVAAAPVAAAPLMATPRAAAPLMATPAPAAARDDDHPAIGSTVLVVAGVMGAIILGTAIFSGQIAGGIEPGPAVIPPQTAASLEAAYAPGAAGAVAAIPEGAGVIAEDVAGKPKVSVYFDTAKTDIAPDFATVAAPLKAYVDSHPGARLAVSGFNDPRGDAAFNAELSKNRAMSVAAALRSIGVPADAIDLEKPPETTDADTTQAQARRVEIVVRDAGAG